MSYSVTSQALSLAEARIIGNGWGPHGFRSKAKNLTKFGENSTLGSSYRTIARWQDPATLDEELLETNALDAVSSDDPADAGKTLILEGHYFTFLGLEVYPGYTPGAELNFFSQAVTLNGADATIPVSLARPLARATRTYRPVGTLSSPTVDTVGNIYVFASSLAGGAPGGVPNDPSATKLFVPAGSQNSLKAATAVSARDVWWINQISCGLERNTGGGGTVGAEIEIQFRQIGGVWALAGSRRYTLRTDSLPGFERNLDLLIPPNSDIRLRIATNGSGTAHGHLAGPLAGRIGTL